MSAPSPWTKLTPSSHGKGATWCHSSGWTVQHCGGHSAVWPYWLRDPKHPNAVTVSDTGKGFVSVDAAKAVVEGLAAGQFETTDEQCEPGTRIVRGVSAYGLRRAA